MTGLPSKARRQWAFLVILTFFDHAGNEPTFVGNRQRPFLTTGREQPVRAHLAVGIEMAAYKKVNDLYALGRVDGNTNRYRRP
jgi:hypothetical protein